MFNKESSKLNNKVFSNLEPSIFAEIDIREAEKVSGGGVGTSPKNFTVYQETSSSKWALSIMF
ncbi:hypothetical protein I8751_20955 [Nostocaceae cyanobacterium CENA357]|uniref:Uncharacterized protein n=1 Tax=Atlanticothrix silvestris CENA357 TaxID=1725252 RepID=A0A8J7HL66_9CYAN|nr:hypothetical protein [Atlanticothrix silvestris]MBH8554778.1 hypothetical protein [Atlanticothrix silvestris CENA357]